MIGVGHAIVLHEFERRDVLVCSCGWSASIERLDGDLVIRAKLDRAARQHLSSIPVYQPVARRPVQSSITPRRYRTFG